MVSHIYMGNRQDRRQASAALEAVQVLLEDRLVDRTGKADREAGVADHRLELGHPVVDLAAPVGRDLLEVVQVDLAVRGPAPTPRRSGRPPRWSARRCRPSRTPRPRLREIPAALLPAHRRRVETRAAAPPTARPSAERSSSSSAEPARTAVELDLDRPAVGERLPGQPQRPAHPPLQVDASSPDRSAAGRRRPAPAAAAASSSSPEAAGQPVLGGGVPVGAGDPAARPRPQDLALEAEQGDHPAVRALTGVRLALRPAATAAAPLEPAARSRVRCSARASRRSARICARASSSHCSGSATPARPAS